MAPRPDTALEVALGQRQRVLGDAQQLLSGHERALQDQASVVGTALARVDMVLMQIDAAQRPAPGVALEVAVLGDLERLLDWCEVQVYVERERLIAVQADTDVARQGVASAHQQVRALELVLEARAAERAEKLHRAELVLADETAARVHSRKAVLR